MVLASPLDCYSSEDAVCISFFTQVQQLVAHGLLPPDSVIHVPNGQKAGSDKIARAITGKKEKRMGVCKSCPDYLIRLPGGGLGWLEAKRYYMDTAGKIHRTYPTKEQKEFLKEALRRKEKAGVFRTPEEGLQFLKDWFNITMN